MKIVFDQVIGNAVRQLQQIATDDTCQDCMELFNNERKTGGKLKYLYLLEFIKIILQKISGLIP